MGRAVALAIAFAVVLTACGEAEPAATNTEDSGPRVVNPVTTAGPATSVPVTSAPSTSATPGSATTGVSPSAATGPSADPTTTGAPETTTTVAPSSTSSTTAAPATSAPPTSTSTTAAPTTTSTPTTTAATTTAAPTTSTSTTTTSTSTTTAAPTTTTTTTTSTTTTTTAAPELALALEVVADGFAQPVLALAPAGDPRLFVVDQPGRIYVIEGEDIHTFLDIRSDVKFRGEQGLLGMAFHPRYSSNGLFYVDFIDNDGDTVLAEFSVSGGNRNAASKSSRRDVLTVPQPASNHNGGMLAFGPDGYLWFGLGDGGGSNDRYGNGQRSDRLLGSMIRLDVGPGAPEPYGLPTGQPFVEEGGLPEVWAIGLRNPWRWAFDGNDLYVADVGHNSREEINIVRAGEAGINYGWPIYEGSNCRIPASCDGVELGPGLPLLTYSHSNGCSVTGGFVYRGSAIPELRGHYFFGDYCGGWIDTVRVRRARTVAERERWFGSGTIDGLTSFGIDANGEVYVLERGGTVYRIVPA